MLILNSFLYALAKTRQLVKYKCKSFIELTPVLKLIHVNGAWVQENMCGKSPLVLVLLLIG